MRQVERDLQFGDGLPLAGLALFDGRELPGARVAPRGLSAAVERTVATDYRGTCHVEGLDLAVRLANGQVPLVVTVSAFGPGGALVLAEARGLTPEGFTHIATLPPGSWELWIGAPGAAVERRAVTVPGEPVEVVLQLAARLKVRIPALATSGQLATVTLTDAEGRAFQAPEPGGPPRGAWQIAAGVGYVEGLPPGTFPDPHARLDDPS